MFFELCFAGLFLMLIWWLFKSGVVWILRVIGILFYFFSDMDLFYTCLVICFLIIEFFVRQLSLNWMWKNKEGTSWEYYIYDQFNLILRYLFIGPILILVIYFSDFELYHIKDTFLKSKSKDPSGWGWYIFTSIGFAYLLFLLELIYKAIKKPKESWQATFDITYDDESRI